MSYHRAFRRGPPRESGEISIQNVFSMREMVVDCLLRDLSPVVVRANPASGLGGFAQARKLPEDHRDPVFMAVKHFGYTNSTASSNVTRLEEELSILKRSLIASEAENRILRKHVGDACGQERNLFHYPPQPEGYASSSSRMVRAQPSTSSRESFNDAEAVYWENVLLKMKIKRWRKFVKAAQCRRNKLQRQMRTLQNEVRQLKDQKGPCGNSQAHFEKKIRALESQVSMLTGMLTRDFPQGQEKEEAPSPPHDLGLDRSLEHFDQVLTHTPTKSKYDASTAENRKPRVTRSLAADPLLSRSDSEAFKVRLDLSQAARRRERPLPGSRAMGTAGLKQALTDVESSQKNMMLDFARNTKGLQNEVEALLDKYHFERKRRPKRVSWKD